MRRAPSDRKGEVAAVADDAWGLSRGRLVVNDPDSMVLGSGSPLPTRAAGPLLLAGLWLCLSGLPAQAQADEPTLALQVVGPPPAGFDQQRLQDRIGIYLAETVAITWLAADPTPASETPAQAPRFLARLEWPTAGLIPLQGRLVDRAADPARVYELTVAEAQSWDELERLVALKLSSLLRVALARRPDPEQQTTSEPACDAASEPQPPTTVSRAAAQLGAGLHTGPGLRAPRAGAVAWLGVRVDSWGFGMTTSLTLPRSQQGTETRAETLEGSVAAAIRYDLRAPGSAWLLQLGSAVGLFAARVKGVHQDRARTGYLLSPVTSLRLHGGSAFGPGERFRWLLGPTLDLLWNRATMTAFGQPLYDSGRVRLRLELRLGF